ncbi:MAG: hypothetical protein NW208_10375 [Bryobacter sp.]|nr:hypothetical protein [Bryobacter sp.]
MRILLLFPLLAFADERILPMRFANLPACPAAGQTKDELLLEARDAAGFAVEIWCTRQASGYAYTYRARGKGGQAKPLDECAAWGRLNSVGVEHTGAVSEDRLENGQPLVKAAGRIVRFFHHNWDGRSGQHTLVDFRSQRYTTYETRAEEDGVGRAVRVLTRAETPVPLRKPSLGKLNEEAPFEAARAICRTATADDGQRVLEQEVDAFMEPGRLSKVAVAYPEANPIEKILFEPRERKLYLRFPPNARKSLVSVAFPRQLLGIGKEITKVRLDGRFIPTDETITATHRTVRFRLEETAKEALLTESGGFPFFLVSSIAIVGGLVIGAVVALLFRRKLPAVRDDEAEAAQA